MAKPRIVAETIYYPQKRHSDIHCTNCGCAIAPNKLIYVNEKNGNTEFLCRNCIDKLVKNFQQQMKKKTFIFPKDEILYIGTSRHKCMKGSKLFIPMTAQFVFEKKKFKLPIVRCYNCKKYVMSGKVYSEHYRMLKEYKLVSSKTGEKIVYYEISSNNINSIPQSPIKQEIPATVRWAATHPYQGGGCSGK